MDRKSLGLLGALLAAVAALRPGPPAAAQPPKPQPPFNAPAAVTASQNCVSDASDPDGPWKALCRYFGPPETSNDPKAHAGRWSCVPGNGPVTFLIAAVPDPEITNLALYFDRVLESLMWAIGDTGYTFEQYWLPWSNRPAMPLTTLSDWNCQRKNLEQRSEQPGVLVFRRGDSAKRSEAVLVAFLVSETPTGGLSKLALDNALEYLQNIAKQSGTPVNEIPLVGPNFSGSLRPLEDELSPFLDANPTVKISVVSGAATSGSAIRHFQSSLAGRVNYSSAIENDERASRLFFDFVKDRWLTPREVAFLSEDETAYGYLSSTLSKTLPEPEKKLFLRYPRQIARLRNAYPDSNPSGSDRPDSSVVEGVRLTLKDASDASPIQLEKDTVDDLSEQQSPASQQAALEQISSNLRRERADYTGIFATDVLDALFLSRYLRLSFPDSRVLTFDSDLLFLREGETAPFTGILSVTNYPLFGRNQHWTKAELSGGVPRRIQFSSRYAEGTYNACRFLLQKDLPGWNEQDDGEFLLEYSRPRSPHRDQPGLWLTALGRDGYWPVALLDWKDPSASPTLFHSRHSPDENNGQEELHPELPSRVWVLLFWLALAFSFAHCIYVFLLLCEPTEGPMHHQAWLVRRAHKIYDWMCPKPSPPDQPKPPAPGPPVRFVRFAFTLSVESCKVLNFILRAYPEPSHSPTGFEIPFLLTATLAIACVVFLFMLSLSVFWTSNPTESFGIWYGGIAAVMLTALAALAVSLVVRSANAKADLRGDKVNPPSSLKQYWPITTPAIAFAIFFCVVIGLLAMDKKYEAGYFFAYRALSLASGVSPAAPLLLLAVVYFYWSWVHLWREHLIWQRRLSRGSIDPDPNAAQHVKRVDECLANIFSPKVWRPALLFFVVWVLVLQPWFAARSIEYRLFDWLYIFELSLLYWMLAVVWSQFIWCWRHFRKFLEWLERNPVHNAFSRLRKETSWVPLVSRPKEHQLFISARAWETLRALQTFRPINLTSSTERSRLATLQAKLSESPSQPDALSKDLENALAAGQEFSREKYGELQRSLEHAAACVRQDLEAFDWKSGNSDSVQREIEGGPKEKLNDSQRLLLLKEELVAYRYLVYIRYVFRHLRNLLRFVIVGFIFSVISLHSYPFLELRWIGVVCWLVLITLGTGIGIVFAQMDRDAILSRLTETKANELGKNFFLRMLQFGALPLLTLVTTQFPAIGRIVSSWLQPALQALR